MVAVANSESADDDPPLALAQDRVPHGGRIVAALDPQPRPPRRLGLGRESGLDQLPAGGDLTRGGVDEEDGHARGA